MAAKFDFSAATVFKLANKGISILRPTVISKPASDMPFATGNRGYSVNDNGCGRIWTFAQVMEAIR
jgi:hypothetical protein